MASYSQIRLNKTKELQGMLRFLKSQLRLLSETEILKLALSEYFDRRRRQSHKEWMDSLPVYQATPEEEKAIEEAEAEYARGEFVEIDMDDEEQVKKFFGV